MRIRTDEKFSYREDTIENVSDLYGANKTRSMLYAAEDVERFVDGILEVLEDEDLTLNSRRAILYRVNTVSPRFEFDFSVTQDKVDAEVSIDT